MLVFVKILQWELIYSMWMDIRHEPNTRSSEMWEWPVRVHFFQHVKYIKAQTYTGWTRRRST